MTPKQEALLDDIGWENHIQDANQVDGEDRDVDEMLDILSTISEDRIEEFEENRYYTPPAERRKEERQAREHMLNSLPDKPPVSGS